MTRDFEERRRVERERRSIGRRGRRGRTGGRRLAWVDGSTGSGLGWDVGCGRVKWTIEKKIGEIV